MNGRISRRDVLAGAVIVAGGAGVGVFAALRGEQEPVTGLPPGRLAPGSTAASPSA
ncbi:MAG: hypothetical protein JWM93_3414, partial [Frankiales bacterium]|nr:hypothetical protein [Frankiales bacterium]